MGRYIVHNKRKLCIVVLLLVVMTVILTSTVVVINERSMADVRQREYAEEIFALLIDENGHVKSNFTIPEVVLRLDYVIEAILRSIGNYGSQIVLGILGILLLFVSILFKLLSKLKSVIIREVLVFLGLLFGAAYIPFIALRITYLVNIELLDKSDIIVAIGYIGIYITLISLNIYLSCNTRLTSLLVAIGLAVLTISDIMIVKLASTKMYDFYDSVTVIVYTAILLMYLITRIGCIGVIVRDKQFKLRKANTLLILDSLVATNLIILYNILDIAYSNFIYIKLAVLLVEHSLGVLCLMVIEHKKLKFK